MEWSEPAGGVELGDEDMLEEPRVTRRKRYHRRFYWTVLVSNEGI